ncbi:Thioesterase family protein [Desulfonema limicola]|uniref:Thioesterase family protein n=1 Tax=Desulfonema limicola TaxID=45656 RepID=A0A975B9J1_9BACT|nr:thioesterase family protein [Desulfonema limicola]QTA81363.1 Thioesterase family protein [Desulfonema limicola]
MQSNIYEVQLKVPFHDLDPVQIVWHGNYFKYFDIARFGLFNQAGIDLYKFYEQTKYLFPISKTSTKHIASLRYGEEFISRATIVEARVKIVMDFQIIRLHDKVICAKGRGEQVAVKMPEMELMFEIPQEIREPFGF